jgi:carbon monoxide dehydrogenase subunit G
MKMREEFVVAESPATLWEFFEQVDKVARCVPGVEDVTVVDADNSRVRVTQAVGPMSATFDLKMRITGREPGRSMEFTAIGRSVKGAAGNVRSTNVVQLEEADGGGTRVVLDGDVALGGMLGSVGQKVVAKQASRVTRSFAQALERELTGGAAANGAPPPEAGRAPAPPAAAGPPPPEAGHVPGPPEAAGPSPAAPPEPAPPTHLPAPPPGPPAPVPAPPLPPAASAGGPVLRATLEVSGAPRVLIGAAAAGAAAAVVTTVLLRRLRS